MTLATQELFSIEMCDLTRGTLDDRRAVAYLHAALMPASPVVRLGIGFMVNFYYHHLVRDGLIDCRLARVNDRPAGFVAYTTRPHDFMLAGLRRHLSALVPVLAGALLERPSRISVVGRALGILKRRRDDLAAGPAYDAEILSLGILPQYRTGDFVRRTGANLGRQLFEEAVAHAQQGGVHTLAMLSEVRDRATLVFLHSLGCQFLREWIDGVDCFTAVYTVRQPG